MYRKKSKKILEFRVLRLNFKICYDSLLVSGFAQFKGLDDLIIWNTIYIWGSIFSISLFTLSLLSDILSALSGKTF